MPAKALWVERKKSASRQFPAKKINLEGQTDTHTNLKSNILEVIRKNLKQTELRNLVPNLNYFKKTPGLYYFETHCKQVTFQLSISQYVPSPSFYLILVYGLSGNYYLFAGAAHTSVKLF